MKMILPVVYATFLANGEGIFMKFFAAGFLAVVFILATLEPKESELPTIKQVNFDKCEVVGSSSAKIKVECEFK